MSVASCELPWEREEREREDRLAELQYEWHGGLLRIKLTMDLARPATSSTAVPKRAKTDWTPEKRVLKMPTMVSRIPWKKDWMEEVMPVIFGGEAVACEGEIESERRCALV